MRKLLFAFLIGYVAGMYIEFLANQFILKTREPYKDYKDA